MKKKRKALLPPIKTIAEAIKDKLDNSPDLSEEEINDLHEQWNLIKEHHKFNKLDYFEPFEYQERFFASGSKPYRARFLCAANRIGKSYGMGYEDALHLTGLYPKWWKGKRYNRPIKLWVVGITNKSTRDSMQEILLGSNNAKSLDALGTGMIPKEHIKFDTIQKEGATAETVLIKHYNRIGEYDGDSELTFKSTQMGHHALMGATVDHIHIDEEDPHHSMLIYTQCLTRTKTTKGQIVISATPENGMTDLVKLFKNDCPPDLYYQQASAWECDLYTDEGIRADMLNYPSYEHGYRFYGDPSVASGLIYPFNLDEIIIDDIKINDNWKRCAGVDLGWDHPTACIWSAYDHENDIIYVYGEYGKSKEIPAVHAHAISSRGSWIPVILPHDSEQTSKNDGVAAIDTWRKVLPQVQSETFYNFHTSDGNKNNSPKVGFDEIRDRMRTGRIKISSSCPTLLSELRNYKMKDGKVYKYNDDYCDAFRYSVMSVINRGVASNGSNNKWASIEQTSAWKR